MSTTKKEDPKYSLEFKQDAVKRVTEKGYTREQTAQHLGISLSAWHAGYELRRQRQANLPSNVK